MAASAGSNVTTLRGRLVYISYHTWVPHCITISRWIKLYASKRRVNITESLGVEVDSGMVHQLVEGLLKELKEKLGRKLDSVHESVCQRMEHMELGFADDKRDVTDQIRILRGDVVSEKRELVNGRSPSETTLMNKLNSLQDDMNTIRNLCNASIKYRSTQSPPFDGKYCTRCQTSENGRYVGHFKIGQWEQRRRQQVCARSCE